VSVAIQFAIMSATFLSRTYLCHENVNEFSKREVNLIKSIVLTQHHRFVIDILKRIGIPLTLYIQVLMFTVFIRGIVEIYFLGNLYILYS